MLGYLLLLLLLSPSSLISNLPLLLLLVNRDALSNISLEFAAFPCRKLVQLELKDFSSILIDHISHNVNDSSLLLWGQLPDIVLQSVFLIKGHRLI